MKKFISLESLKKIKSFIISHKIWSGLIVIILIIIGYYTFGNKTSAETRYVMSTVAKGTVITSVTGSGQVSDINQIDIKSKASADVVSVNVSNGQTIKAGALIAKLDSTVAEKGVRDAQINLTQAQLSLEKLQQPADKLSLMQAESALSQAQSDLDAAHNDGFTDVANTFIDMPNIMNGLHDILYLSDLAPGNSQLNVSYYGDAIKDLSLPADSQIAQQYVDDANQKYQLAQTSYSSTLALYGGTTRYSDSSQIEKLVSQTYETTKTIAEAVKSAMNLIQSYQDAINNHNQAPIAKSTTHLTNLSSYTNKISSDLSNLLTINNTIITANINVPQKQQALDELQAGATDIDLKTAQLTVDQRKNALIDAQQELANYSIIAPFDGTITGLAVKKFDTVSSGSTVGTLITKQKVAEISLNEVDVAKINLGQKVTLTFDAISGLSIAGTVSEIDAVGAVSQGVVTYQVKISFDTQDDRIKDGMSVDASIITNIKQDVLTVPNSAVKTKNGTSYVEMFNPPLPPAPAGAAGSPSSTPPIQQIVTAGLSGDSVTEIVSGLNEGDQVVSRTIASSAATKTAASSAPSLIGGGSFRGAAGR
ncbi:MAG TPA: HlyD family efflux transporter periplasmic adaptor subunit [Candidatus Paceibacterota bacterium]|nr:HlyD family efflux transporter periplasmic adaptor subunit [Candidatus Paceibacterota bacterium]